MQYFGFDRPSFAFKTYGFGSNFDPMTLFAGGKQGVFYDPSDKSTLFQDVAGTVPVTKDGDPVALMKDKSGNGNHATQTVSASRPTYHTDGVLHWLQRDGADDFMNISRFSSAIPQPFSAVFADKVEYTATAYRFLFDSELANRSYVLKSTAANTLWISSGATRHIEANGLMDGVAEVSAFLFNGENSRFRKNNQAAVSMVIGTSGIQGVTLFSRDTGIDTLKGRFYGCALIAGTDYDNADLKQYLAAKAGVII